MITITLQWYDALYLGVAATVGIGASGYYCLCFGGWLGEKAFGKIA